MPTDDEDEHSDDKADGTDEEKLVGQHWEFSFHAIVTMTICFCRGTPSMSSDWRGWKTVWS
jgi:hypothetical protein